MYQVWFNSEKVTCQVWLNSNGMTLLRCATIASCKQCCAALCSFRLAPLMLCIALVIILIYTAPRVCTSIFSLFIVYIRMCNPNTQTHTHTLHRRLVVKKIVPPAVSDWRPLVVLANPRSGGNDGPKVLSGFRKLLNPIQVWRLGGGEWGVKLRFTRTALYKSCAVTIVKRIIINTVY